MNKEFNVIQPIRFINPYFRRQELRAFYFHPPLVDQYETYIFVDNKVVVNIIPNRYMVSNYGNIWDTYTNKFIPYRYDKRGYHITQLSCYTDDYCHVYIKTLKVHRIVLLMFNYIIGCEDLQVNHIDGNKSNNKLYNLEWTTRQENIDHARINHLLYRVTTDEQINEVCRLLSEGESFNNISLKTGVSHSLINQIRRGIIHKDISSNYTFIEHDKPIPLSDEQVHYICKLLEEGERICNIARLLNTEIYNVANIKCRKNHKDISKDYIF